MSCRARRWPHRPSALVLPPDARAGALQFSIFPLAKRAGRNFGPLWLSTAFLELFAGVLTCARELSNPNPASTRALRLPPLA